MRPPRLVDHHCHGTVAGEQDRAGFESYLTESDRPPAPGTTFFDTQLGFAVRRWCPPLLGLPAHCPPDEYLARRRELGPGEAARRLLTGSGIDTFLVDTGLPGVLPGTGTVHEIVRLEHLAEDVAAGVAAGSAGAGAYVEAVTEAVERSSAVGFKSVVAYRHGLALPPDPPGAKEVRAAAAAWLAGPVRRLTDPVLIRHLLWTAAGTGLPLQLHTGFGDPDLRLQDCDPLLLTDFVRAVEPTGCPLVLLHGYPYHRQSGYLAQVYPHVHADMGLSLSHTGARAEAVLAEMLELTPFGKLLFSTDAYGLPELYAVGAALFREALGSLLGRWTESGAWSQEDAGRVAELVAFGNAERVYGLGPG
ncbi:amidohydrolase family protein [Streptomyces sp. NPDC050504]|uniref:amidohydrolase family protein n=1 Tax=Streptomyces sp. NPDC050504 TaxID=3365618 RepID=UPI003794A71C